MTTVKVRWSFVVIASFAITIDGWVSLGSPSSKRFLLRLPLNLASFEREAQEWIIGNTTSGISSWLVCGDGDLSYSAAIAPRLSCYNISLTASVLEDQVTHNRVYSNSSQHINTISSYSSARVVFGIDATQLWNHFPDQKFDRIQFNFPHWRGKANNKRNQELLSAFFDSAVQVLSPRGEVLIALCPNQGGSQAKTMQEWKASWKAALYAAECGLILHSVDKFCVIYDLSSHRGVDRPFWIGENPNLYRFRFPNRTPVDDQFQLCCRHELHTSFPISNSSGSIINDVPDVNAIKHFVQTQIVPEGVKVDIPQRAIRSTPEGEFMIIYLVLYRGESLPLTRLLADSFRATLEIEIGKKLQLRQNRVGRMVSKPFPHSALNSIIMVPNALE